MHETILYMDNIFAKSLWITDDHYDDVAQCQEFVTEPVPHPDQLSVLKQLKEGMW